MASQQHGAAPLNAVDLAERGGGTSLHDLPFAAPHEPSRSDRSLSGAQLRALHERFVAQPAETDLSALRPVIARSWARSLRWSVSPELRQFVEFREPRVDDQLMACATPVLDELERMSSDTGAMIYLADQDGTITEVRGRSPDGRGGPAVAPPGTAMSEDITGTNSDGTALEEGRPVQVWGAEHFCEGMQHLCCTSVPVIDPLRRSVRAVLSLSIPERFIHGSDARSMALIAQGAAAEVTQRLAARLVAREQALLSSYLVEMRKRGADSVVVMDGRTTIASDSALHMLRQSDYAVLAGYARESEHLSHELEREVTLGPGTTLQLQARPITSGGETIGTVIRLRPPKPRKNARARTSTPRRTDSFDSVVGESLALRRALEVASTVVRRRMPAYIVGERGTGKAHLAEAIAKATSSDVLVWDCASPNGLDRKAIQQLQEHLGAGAAAVLHADNLTPRSRQLLVEALKPLDNPAAILTMSCVRDETMDLTTALAGVEIEMPPLRSRRDDIPLLAAHFLANAAHGVRTVSPTLLRGLTEADWTGNIAQLKDFIDTAAARCSSDELGTQHLSEQHRRTIARHPLSRLEEAELHQIREALADSGGNRLRAAELLQIGRSTLYRKIESYTRRGFALEL